MEKMRATVLSKPFDIKIRTIDIPRVGVNHVLVKVTSASICNHTDTEMFEGRFPQNLEYPCIPGHEICGLVEKIGEEVKDIKVRDRVTLFTPDQKYDEEIALFWGGFAEYIRVPEECVFKIPLTISDEEGALLMNTSEAFNSIKKADIKVGDRVLILGQGSIGWLHVQLAKMSGALEVIATDLFDAKLKLSKQFGADITVNAKRENPVKVVDALTDGEGVDVVIECVGSQATFSQALKTVRAGGRIVAFGLYTKPLRDVDLSEMYWKEPEIVGVRGVGWKIETIRENFRTAIKLLSTRMVRVKPMISHRMPLERIEDALRLIREKPSEVVKIVLKP